VFNCRQSCHLVSMANALADNEIVTSGGNIYSRAFLMRG